MRNLKKGIGKLPRVDGFLAEYLTPTFFVTNVPSDKIKYLKIFDPNEETKLKESNVL